MVKVSEFKNLTISELLDEWWKELNKMFCKGTQQINDIDLLKIKGRIKEIDTELESKLGEVKMGNRKEYAKSEGQQNKKEALCELFKSAILTGNSKLYDKAIEIMDEVAISKEIVIDVLCEIVCWRIENLNLKG